MTKIILGIDPGQSTGVAVFRAGELSELLTIRPVELDAVISAWKPARVIFEDSRLQSKVWAPVKGAALLKIARNVGEIDAWCRLITAVCDREQVAAHGISPKDKGKKLTKLQFCAATGWTLSSNEHTRDAAMVAWPYRRAASNA